MGLCFGGFDETEVADGVLVCNSWESNDGSFGNVDLSLVLAPYSNYYYALLSLFVGCEWTGLLTPLFDLLSKIGFWPELYLFFQF